MTCPQFRNGRYSRISGKAPKIKGIAQLRGLTTLMGLILSPHSQRTPPPASCVNISCGLIPPLRVPMCRPLNIRRLVRARIPFKHLLVSLMTTNLHPTLLSSSVPPAIKANIHGLEVVTAKISLRKSSSSSQALMRMTECSTAQRRQQGVTSNLASPTMKEPTVLC